MQFTCLVDSEANYDGLKIFIDRAQVGGLIFGLSSFTTFNVSLTSGYHFIQFVYFKDGSVSRGADQAVINVFRIFSLFLAVCNTNHRSLAVPSSLLSLALITQLIHAIHVRLVHTLTTLVVLIVLNAH